MEAAVRVIATPTRRNREGGREREREREGGRKAWRAIESEGERVRALLDG